MNKIRSFTDLHVWKEGHSLVLKIYQLTNQFPAAERFFLVDQMRRASISITSNISEGFGKRTYKEKLLFYYHSHGSLIELKNQLLISRDLNYLKKEEFHQLASQINIVHKLLQGLITKTKSFLNHDS